MSELNVVIAGAGPAGLTAALELQAQGISDITILEAGEQVGGISRTYNHNGNRIDIGGHRFFSKSDWVMNWWTSLLPLEKGVAGADVHLQYQGQSRSNLPSTTSEVVNKNDVMLLRNRLSRIYFNRNFFDYPLKLNVDSLRKLGLRKTVTFGVSYVVARLRPRKPEVSLEDFLVNRFGNKLYRQFFKEYTEKVWGVPCHEISAEWGAQRIKSLSILKAMTHAIKSALGLQGKAAAQTSLIESFIYPKYGPGQMWEAAARKFVESGGKLLMQHKVVEVDISESQVHRVTAQDSNGLSRSWSCSHFISTMPIKDLVSASHVAWPDDALNVAQGLQYRDFFTVGLLYPKSALVNELRDNWIYIQEPGVDVGRVQVFNNWSPYMVADPDNVWLGLEFFCSETDSLWKKTDEELIQLAKKEMLSIALVNSEAAFDAVVLRVPKAYPGYFGAAYKDFDKLRSTLDKIENMYLIGRNGMHHYNNQEHSRLTAKEAADQIAGGYVDKGKIWAINVDDEYHEEKSPNLSDRAPPAG